MQKIIGLALGIGAFLCLCHCAPTAPPPAVRPSERTGDLESSTPDFTPDSTPSAVPSAVPSPGASPPASVPTVPPSAGEPLPGTPVLAQLRLETDRRLFDAFGQTGQLKVIALDAAGIALPSEALALSFSSTRPTDFSVSETGMIRALKDIGFSTVRVTDGVSGQFAEITLSVSSASFSGGGGGGGGSRSAGNTTPATLNTTTEFEGLEEDPA